jgi:hypothetical protein
MAFPMPGVVSRDKYFQRLDKLLNAFPDECLQALQDPANSALTLYEVAANVWIKHSDRSLDEERRDAEAVRRVRTYWYAQTAAQDYFNIDRTVYTPEVRRNIVRYGYMRALAEAVESKRKIRSQYCCTGRFFEVVVTRMEPEDPIVSVIVITGEIRDAYKRATFPLEVSENVWVSTVRQRILEAIDGTNPGNNPIFEDGPSLAAVVSGKADLAYPEPGSPVGLLRPRTTDDIQQAPSLSASSGPSAGAPLQYTAPGPSS